MMDKARRKDLVREYKERKEQLGVFAVRCEPAGKVWVASTRNLDRQQNRVWFVLRNGGQGNKAMAEAWKAHGEASFRYEILEEVTDDNPLLLDSLLKDRTVHWLKELSAAPVVA